MALDGSYQVTVKTPMGAQESKWVLKVDGSSVTGTSEDKSGASPIENGKVDGDAFEFLATAKTPMGAIKVTMKGKVEGDTVSGQAMSPFGPAPFSGTRL